MQHKKSAQQKLNQCLQMQEMSPKTESQQNANQSSTYELLWSFFRKKEALDLIQNSENSKAFNSPHTIQKS